jgi:large subunit ribosomal protein L24e
MTIWTVAKKRTRRTVKFQRAIVGATWDQIKEKRNQKPEERQSAREEAIRKAKEFKQKQQAVKKAETSKVFINAILIKISTR